MFLVLWEFEVKPDKEERFESVYGASGAWQELFRRDTNFQKTLVLRDPFRPRVYVTLDFWYLRDAYHRFKEKYADEYHRIDKSCEDLTLSQRSLGEFEICKR
jgi:hypothetical protein